MNEHRDPESTRFKIARRIGQGAFVGVLASAALTLGLSSQALASESSASTHPPKVPSQKPRVETGSVTHARGGTVVLDGTVDPRGLPTTYFFKYGPTVAYGAQTPVTAVGSGTTVVKVGQTVGGFLVGYHYRIVASNAAGTTEGKDRVYAATPSQLTFSLNKPGKGEQTQIVYGRPYIVSGTLAGPGAANHQIVLQESAFPYLEAFKNVTAPVLTDPAGRFLFRIPSMRKSTQFRVSTLDLRPLFSRTITVHVAVRVILHVRSAKRHGYVEFYGVMMPAKAVKAGTHLRVLLQLEKSVRPKSGESEKTIGYATQFIATLKKATASALRFSVVVSPLHSGRYRAFVKLPKSAPLASGYSQTVFVHANPPPKHKGRRSGAKRRSAKRHH